MSVTKADLDAAADLIEAYWSRADDAMMRLARDTRAGHRQGAFPRAFARHRTAAEAANRAEVERLREALRHIAKQWPDSFAARHARAALTASERGEA